MGMTPEQIASAAKTIAERARTVEQDLNAADGKLGDGDTGVMLRRVLEQMAIAANDLPHDLGDAFRKLALASASATGSSLGTLLSTALLTFANAAKGKNELPWDALGGVLALARDAMLARGKAKIGDKTVVDSLDAVARAIAGQSELASIRQVAATSARKALNDFRGKPCRMGRARIFGDKSVGLDDPGMLAFSIFVEELCAIRRA